MNTEQTCKACGSTDRVAWCEDGPGLDLCYTCRRRWVTSMGHYVMGDPDGPEVCWQCGEATRLWHRIMQRFECANCTYSAEHPRPVSKINLGFSNGSGTESPKALMASLVQCVHTWRNTSKL